MRVRIGTRLKDEDEGPAFGRSTDIPVFFSFSMLDDWR